MTCRRRSSTAGRRLIQAFATGLRQPFGVDFMTGMVPPEGNVWSRPVAVTQTQQGARVVSDDAGNCLWRIRHGRPGK